MMKFSLLLCSFFWTTVTITASSSHKSSGNNTPPLVPVPETWLPPLPQNDWILKEVKACCVATSSTSSRTCQSDDEEKTCLAAEPHQYEPVVVGHMPQFTAADSLQVLEAAVEAWQGGTGVWTRTSLADRIAALERFFARLQTVRSEMVQALQYEIGKTAADAASEFDRTVQFFQQCVQVLQTDAEFQGTWQTVGSTQALVRRAAFGIVLGLAPANYPLNESYAMLLPALLAGNIVILKIPATGGLVHLLTMQALKETLPPGTVNFVAGSGRATMPVLMESGKIDGLAFIGGAGAADALLKAHPHPHRLKVFLQLEGNNMAVLLSDLFHAENAHLLEHAHQEIMAGALSYNGQRCTALKLIQVPAAHATQVAQELARRVEALPVGLSTDPDAKITPLPNQGRIEYMQELLDDALKKGARVMNQNGGKIVGGPDSTLMVPAVLYPVTPDMRVYQEEQFGPLVPVASYDDIQEVIAFGRDGAYAQQVSLFTQDAAQAAALVDVFAAIFGKINLNGQCARSPDTVPFSGRRSSALGVMSVREALREFSVPTVVAYKQATAVADAQETLARQLDQQSTFLQTL